MKQAALRSAARNAAPAHGSSHDRIRDAAKALFGETGYESTSTLAICRMAGTNESQLLIRSPLTGAIQRLLRDHLLAKRCDLPPIILPQACNPICIRLLSLVK